MLAHSRSRRGVAASTVAVIMVIVVGTSAAVGATVYYSRNSTLLGTNLLSPSNDGTSEQTSNASLPISTSQPSVAGQISVTAQDLVPSYLAGEGNSATLTCATGFAPDSITLTNKGVADVAATSMSIAYGGAVYNFPITGACTVTATGVFGGNPLYITMAATDLVTGARAGASFTGTVAMSNGLVLIFAGNFQ